MCDCIEKVEIELRKTGTNTMLDIPISFSGNGNFNAMRVTVSTCKRDDRKRNKPIRVFASFCPFCGEKYKEKEEQ